RGWGKCCVVGCAEIEVEGKRVTTKSGKVIHEGDWITINGTKGLVYEGALPLVDVDLEHNYAYGELMKLCDTVRVLKVRTNADTPKDAAKAVTFGAEGIGLFRTEHMFYGEGSDKPLFLLRKMIMSKTPQERKLALEELSAFVKKDIKATLETLNGLPVTIRLLDPPLHEFVPHHEDKMAALAAELNVDLAEAKKRGDSLKETNPMLGHRGVRLGITYPEVSEMQIRAILEAAGELIKEGKKAFPEIMIPVTCTVAELDHQKVLVTRVYKEVCQNLGLSKIPFMYGTMIEIPRAALLADKMAGTAEFFSFGTNDLTQMSFGFSRDDIGGFLPDYLTNKILPADPFVTIDQDGVGQLIKYGIERGRSIRPDLKVGICGEHGGDPESVKFCHKVGMNYVSCSPFRVPIARLAAAQAAVEEKLAGRAPVQKAAVKKAAPKAAKKPVAKKAPVKKAAKKATKKTVGKAAKKAVKKIAKKTVKKAMKKVLKKVARKTVRKAAKKKK
ncbi:MAG: pyruvate, phosphate dikinase, partial [Chitinispirillaceae bacterium]|nr:pyruvate, phosphate dikinase [Chitinispirillaceae bacterium]